MAVELSWLFAFVTAKPEEAVVEEFLRCGLAQVVALCWRRLSAAPVPHPRLAQALVRRLAAADALSPTTVPVVRALGNLTSGTATFLPDCSCVCLTQ